jgi:hypothetical protein
MSTRLVPALLLHAANNAKGRTFTQLAADWQVGYFLMTKGQIESESGPNASSPPILLRALTNCMKAGTTRPYHRPLADPARPKGTGT